MIDNDPTFAVSGEAWELLKNALVELSAKDTEENAASMMALLDKLLGFADAHTDNTPIVITSLIAFVTEWVTEYEDRHVQIPESNPLELLRDLMDANGLRQVDLAEIFGGQPVVSAVLRGERKINLRQARSLGKRFSLDFSAFISDADVGPFKDQPTVIGEELVGYSDSKIFVEMFPRSKPILTASNCSFTRMVRSAKSTSKAKPGIPYRPTPVHPISTYTQNSALYRMDDEQKNTTTSNIVERRQELVACA